MAMMSTVDPLSTLFPAARTQKSLTGRSNSWSGCLSAHSTLQGRAWRHFPS